MFCKKIQKERNVILLEFKKLGFRGMTAFYNVCKSLDVTLNGFELIDFYQGREINKSLVNKLHSIIECIKSE